jgi:hypothetical protein
MGNRQAVNRLLCYSNKQALSAVVKTSALKHVDVPSFSPVALPLSDKAVVRTSPALRADLNLWGKPPESLKQLVSPGNVRRDAQSSQGGEAEAAAPRIEDNAPP